MKVCVLIVILMMTCRCYGVPSAYQQVADTYKIPADILYAIAFTESGYTYQSIQQPWPWTLNIEGKAYRFHQRHAMLRKVQQAIQHKHSIDIGIMQINWRWHQHRFSSLQSALDPYVNLQIGAEILVEQYDVTSDWWAAVGRYHAPAQDTRSIRRAEQYRQRVQQNWLNLTKHRSSKQQARAF